MGTIEQEIEQWAKSTLPVYEFMDLGVVSVSEGVYQCFVPLTKNTGNHINTVHAAFQWASAEILGGLVVLTKRSEEKYVPVSWSTESFGLPLRP
jgi:acyl-coenzyme A thioesterase PaaI-like protein